MKIRLGEVIVNVVSTKGALDSLISSLETDKIIIMDEAILSLTMEILPALSMLEQEEYLILKGRKENKNIKTLFSILEVLEKRNFPRNGTIIAIGGGVVGDIAGLAASLWYRGCNLIHVPTTFLACVDSCLGGKTAVNFGKTINALGTYHHPQQIILEPKFLHHLPHRDFISAMAEVIKYTIIGNGELSQLLDDLTTVDLAEDEILTKIIQLSLAQKAEFVKNDIRENNQRLFLNLGHTIGHALEVSTVIDNEECLRHGEGVALGLMAISHISQKLNRLSELGVAHIQSKLEKFSLPISVNPEISFGLDKTELTRTVLNAVFRDKKRVGQTLRLILPIDAGDKCEIYHTNDRDLIQYGIEKILR